MKITFLKKNTKIEHLKENKSHYPNDIREKICIFVGNKSQSPKKNIKKIK